MTVQMKSVNYLFVVFAMFCGLRLAAAQDTITFVTTDSIIVHGDFYASAAASNGILILLHMNHSNRSVWKSFAEKAVAQDFDALAIDFRGHGESTQAQSREITFESLTNDDYAKMINDVDGAVRWLRSDPELANLPIGIIGASIGANVALSYAVSDESIPAIVMISPGEDYRGVQTLPAIKLLENRPCLIISAEDDNYSSVSSRKLAGGEGITLFQYEAGGHGTLLFEAQVDFSDRLIQYMLTHLKQN